MHGCTSEMKVMGSAYSLTSDQALMDRVRRVCEENLHLPVSGTTSSRNGGSEDVSYMMRRVQEQGGQAQHQGEQAAEDRGQKPLLPEAGQIPAAILLSKEDGDACAAAAEEKKEFSMYRPKLPFHSMAT